MSIPVPFHPFFVVVFVVAVAVAAVAAVAVAVAVVVASFVAVESCIDVFGQATCLLKMEQVRSRVVASLAERVS